MKKHFLLICVLLALVGISNSQITFPAFADDIVRFKKQDSINQPLKNAILFVGSSSFTRWIDVNNYFPGYTIINRGFGGSTLVDIIRYAYDIILPYQPKQVVIYCGENDLADNNLSVKEVVNRFKTLYQLIRINLPYAAVHFVSLKPSPSRQALLSQIQDVNRQVETFLKKEKNTGFINVYPHMVDAKGNIMPEIFVDDRLHMNEKGYAIWKRVFQPYLVK